MDEELRQTMVEVREMKKMCGNINMKLTNIVTQRGQDYKKKLEAEYQRGFEDGKAVHEKGCEGCKYEGRRASEENPCFSCSNYYQNYWTAKDDKIEVGDEVIYNGTTKCLVVRPETDERYASLIDGDGAHYSADHRECKKTGRHFDIASILEEMRND